MSATGQIGLDQAFGRWLTLLAALPEVRTIVEVGTWEGRGSTKLLAVAAAKSNPEARIISLESDADRAHRAARRNKRMTQLEIVHGSLVTPSDLSTEDLSPEESVWLQQDLEALASCPIVIDRIPSQIDLLLLDGGEFSTNAEYALLAPRTTKWLALDDTRMRKSRDIAAAIRAGAEPFTVVWDSPERNGCMVAVRR